MKISPKNVHKLLSSKMLVDGFPIVFDPIRSKGSYIYDSKSNKKYLDFFGFFATRMIGYNHEGFNDKNYIKKTLNMMNHNPSNSDIYTIEMAEFVESFNSVIPDNFDKLHLTSGGSVAVENALKTAFDFKYRLNQNNGININENHLEILHFKNCFHGRTGYSLSLTNTDPTKYKYFPKFNWPRFEFPALTFYKNGESINYGETSIINQIENYIKKNNKKIAGLIIEPIQGEGGNHIISKSFWTFLREITFKNDILLIADEVQSGMFISGKTWAFEHYISKPDIICFGKKAQVCGIIANNIIDKVDNVFKVSSRINSTWGGNILDMMRCTKLLEIMHTNNYIENVNIQGEYLLSELRKINYIYNVRGKGLMIGFNVSINIGRDRLIDILYKNNIIVLPAGKSSIRLRPMLDVSRYDIDLFLEKLNSCINILKL